MTTDLPSPPFYQVPNLNNFRDAALAYGGLKTNDGRSIRPGLLYRSAEVSRVDGEGWKVIGGLGVKHVFDLRSKPEVDKGWAGITGEESKAVEDAMKGWEDALRSAGVERSWVPVFAADDYSPERLAERYMKYLDEAVEGFVSAYQDILTHGGAAFRTILLYLASLSSASLDSSGKNPLGALIHCTAGKDRTGIFFGLLLSFLGVSDEQIANEYQLTEPGLKHIYEQVLPRLMASPAFERYKKERMDDASDEQGRQAALRMLGAKKESMLGALGMLRKEWGSPEEYMRKVCGLSHEDLAALKRNLIIES